MKIEKSEKTWLEKAEVSLIYLLQFFILYRTNNMYHNKFSFPWKSIVLLTYNLMNLDHMYNGDS